MPIRVVVADDHPLVLSALEDLLADSGDFQVVASCHDGLAALDAVRQHSPDLLLLDLAMPGRDGLAVLRQLRQDNAATVTVMFVGEITEEQMQEARDLGVGAIVMKGVHTRQLLDRITQVYRDVSSARRGG